MSAIIGTAGCTASWRLRVAGHPLRPLQAYRKYGPPEAVCASIRSCRSCGGCTMHTRQYGSCSLRCPGTAVAAVLAMAILAQALLVQAAWAGTWQTVTSPQVPGFHLNGIWGSAANDVYTVGATGSILHWNGTAWSLMASPDQPGTLRHLGQRRRRHLRRRRSGHHPPLRRRSLDRHDQQHDAEPQAHLGQRPSRHLGRRRGFHDPALQRYRAGRT